MDACSSKWLRTVVASIGRFQRSGPRDLKDLAGELSHLAWSDCAPTVTTIGGERDRFRRHPIAGAQELGCSALLMYWPPGHATLPHDHGGFWGIEVVLDGALHVEEFVRTGSPAEPSLSKSRCLYLGIGDVAVFDSSKYVHRCRNLSNAAPTLTLNVYGGTLEQYVAFEDVESGTCRAQPRVARSDRVVE